MIHNPDYDMYTGLRRLDESTGIHDIPRDERIDIATRGFVPPFAALIACAYHRNLHMHKRLRIGVIKGACQYRESLLRLGGDNKALLDEFFWEPDGNVAAEQQAWFEELLDLSREGADPCQWPLQRFEDEVAEVIEMYLAARGKGLATEPATVLAVNDDVIDAMYEAHAWLRRYYPELLESKPKAAVAA
ncbi:hypothetical protein PDESU_05512 [Pontiella desulfatans]|uniref:Uncharacterized protein n=1 Tax=Pontiella desulfatans TaxID=2750659 RepID=A0A6C2UA57_PONDE|nr:hypothetical protein [Pontiella desulfatans]VGO16920.1 hypothetical protein PDESU_05512 [Pontiella desulfatans]